MSKRAICIFILGLMQVAVLEVPAHAGGDVILRDRSSEGLRTHDRGAASGHVDPMERPDQDPQCGAACQAKASMPSQREPKRLDLRRDPPQTSTEERLEVDSEHHDHHSPCDEPDPPDYCHFR